MRETLGSLGMEIVAAAPQAYAEYLHREFKLYGDIIRRANIRIE